MIGCFIAKIPTKCTTIEDEATRLYLTPAVKFPYTPHLKKI